MTREGLAWLATFLMGTGAGAGAVVVYQGLCRMWAEDREVERARLRHPSHIGHTRYWGDE